jgi:hypothetical protein
MTTHRVKSWSHFYDAILAGDKLHDLRKNDRGYKVGDYMQLERYDNIKGHFTGESTQRKITFITDNQFPCAYSAAVLPHDYCILSLSDDL